MRHGTTCWVAVAALVFSSLLAAQDVATSSTISPTPTTGSAPATAVPSATPPNSAPAPSAAVLAQVPPAVTRLLTVVGTDWGANRATMTAWTRTGQGGWHLEKTFAARLGARGLAPAAVRRQNTLTTPSGSFTLGRAFGTGPKPGGTRLSYRRVISTDWWVYDPRDASTYNRWVTGRARTAKWRKSWAEHLVRYGQQYRYALVIDYNFALSPGTPRLTGGGGIFLHVNGTGSTAGCVSVSAAAMRWILRWLEPSAGQIVIGTAANLA